MKGMIEILERFLAAMVALFKAHIMAEAPQRKPIAERWKEAGSPVLELRDGEVIIDGGRTAEEQAIHEKIFWDGIPYIGQDKAMIIAHCKDAYPVCWQNPDPFYNRRELFRSIVFLRTKSKRQWVVDVPVSRGEYVQDVLLKDVAGKQQIPHREFRLV